MKRENLSQLQVSSSSLSQHLLKFPQGLFTLTHSCSPSPLSTSLSLGSSCFGAWGNIAHTPRSAKDKCNCYCCCNCRCLSFPPSPYPLLLSLLHSCAMCVVVIMSNLHVKFYENTNRTSNITTTTTTRNKLKKPAKVAQ